MKPATNKETTLQTFCRDFLRFNDPTQSWGKSDQYMEVLAWSRAVSAFFVVLLSVWGVGYVYQNIKLNSTQQHLEQCEKSGQSTEACVQMR